MSFDIASILKIAKKAGEVAIEHPAETIAVVDGIKKAGNKIKDSKKGNDSNAQNVDKEKTMSAMYEEIKKNKEKILENTAKDEHNIRVFEHKLEGLQKDSKEIKSLLSKIELSLEEAYAEFSDLKNKVFEYRKLVYISVGISVVASIIAIVAIIL